jgi:hypothetical protein
MSDPYDRLDGYLSEMGALASGRLSFHDQCAAFVLLQRGFSRGLVAKTFGISPSAATHIGDCLSPGSKRYAKVADAYRAMGEEAFGRAYFTQDIDDRLARFRLNVPKQGDFRRGRAPNPGSDLDAGDHQIPVLHGRRGDIDTITVFWADGRGWTFRKADEWTCPEIFKTSMTALDEAWKSYGHAKKPT